MLITCVCVACTKVNICVVNSGRVVNNTFYPDGWNVLYSDDSAKAKSQVVSVCSQDCMQIYVNRTKVPNSWVASDGNRIELKPMEIH